MSEFLRPIEIRSVLDKLRNAKSVEEIATDETRIQMERMCNTIKETIEKVPASESAEIIRAFLDGDPAGVLKRLVEFRSGSASDQSRFEPKVVEIDIDNKKLHFSVVYGDFFSSLKALSQSC